MSNAPTSHLAVYGARNGPKSTVSVSRKATQWARLRLFGQFRSRVLGSSHAESCISLPLSTPDAQLLEPLRQRAITRCRALNRHSISWMALSPNHPLDAHLLGTVLGQQSAEDQLWQFSISRFVPGERRSTLFSLHCLRKQNGAS